jgi:hypothetical protein
MYIWVYCVGMKEKIKWKYLDQDKPHYDLTGTYRGKSCDILSNYKGTWSYLYNLKFHKQGFETREKAVEALEQFLEDNF